MIDNEAAGSVKTFLAQSPMFIFSASGKVFLNVKQYLIEYVIYFFGFHGGGVEGNSQRLGEEVWQSQRQAILDRVRRFIVVIK